MTEHHRAVTHFFKIKRAYPNMFDAVARYRRGKGREFPSWPGWCFIPMAGWREIALEQMRSITKLNMWNVSQLSAIGTWGYSQGVYTFSKPLLTALLDHPLDGEIPTDVLLRLPEYCIYVDLQNTELDGFGLVHGFFSHLEWDANTQSIELRLLIDGNSELELELFPFLLPLAGGSVLQMVERGMKLLAQSADVTIDLNNSRYKNYIAAVSQVLLKLVTLLLYICSEEPDIVDDRSPGSFPRYAHPKKMGKSWRLDPAKKVRHWNVGSEIQKRLIEVETAQRVSATGARTVVPHIRRAHWHGFWTGVRSGERKFVYRWIPPIIVNG